MLTRKCMGWPLSTGGGAAGLDGNHPPLLSLAAWPVGVGECGNRTISPRTLQCKQQKLNSHWPRQRRNLLALMKGEDTRAALGSEGKSLGTRASRRATVRWVPPGLSPVLPIFHQHFTVSFHLLASISDSWWAFSTWHRSCCSSKERAACSQSLRISGRERLWPDPSLLPGESGAVGGQPGSRNHPFGQNMGCDRGKGHRETSWKDTNQQSSIQAVSRVVSPEENNPGMWINVTYFT